MMTSSVSKLIVWLALLGLTTAPSHLEAAASDSSSRSLSENPIWLRAACFATGLRPAASTIYTDITCFAVLASHETAPSRANDGILRKAPSLQTLDSSAGRLVVTSEDGINRLELRDSNGAQLAQPTEGLWSIAMGWKNDWPAQWQHGLIQACERSGPWLVLSGTVSTDQGDWLVRDAYIAEGRRIRCVRRWQWQGKQPARNVTLSVRWQAPQPGAAVMLPGVCYHGNPSGTASGAERVATYTGRPGDELFCEEHRLTMPFVAVEWQEQQRLCGAALHTLPSLASHANKTDQWWSLGLVGRDQSTELSLLSGPCSINGRRGTVKANQRKLFPYTDTHLTVPAGAVIEKTVYLQVYPIGRKGSGFQVPLRETLDLYHPFSTDGLPTMKEILEAKYRFTLSRWHEGAHSAGFRMYPHNNKYVMGWAGQSDAPGYALLVLASTLEAPEAVAMATRGMNHLATAPLNENGFPVRYDPDQDQWTGQDPISQGQAMESFARAILAGRKIESVNTSTWEVFLRQACDIHAARILGQDWRPKSTNEGFLVSPLCKAYGLFGDSSYRQAALKAAEHYADRHLDMTEPYWGGTLDARCEDKEGAWAGFQAFLAVYEMTKESKYLQWAEHAMDVTLTYTVVWDVDMPPGRLRDHGLKTRGWTIVSAQNQHLDVFGVLYTPEIYRMGTYLGRDDLKKLAAVMYRSCGQMLDPEGSQGEQLNHTNFVQGMNHIQDVHKMRGTYREDWTVYWMTAHFLNAAAQFQEMGVSLDY
jgi:hypothetical protein